MIKIMPILGIFIFNCFISYAQDEEKNNWNFTIVPYLYVPYTSGDIIVAGNEENIKASPGDVLGDLKMAGMLYFEAANPKWSISADFIYLDLGTDLTVPAPPAPAPLSADLEAKATLLGFYGMYRVVNWFEVGIGARVNTMDAKLKLASTSTPPAFPQMKFDAPDTWVDPIIAMRFTVPIENENWHAGMRGEFGGFGVGSDFSWMVYPYGGYQFSRLFELSLGFRAMGLSYDNDSDLKVDITLYGPQIGFLFHL